MAKSLLEHLPDTGAAGKRQAAQVLEQFDGQNRLSAWYEQVNELQDEQRDGQHWRYVLPGETIVKDWKKKRVRASELVNYACLRRSSAARQEKFL